MFSECYSSMSVSCPSFPSFPRSFSSFCSCLRVKGGHYDLFETLGYGGFSRVYRGVDRRTKDTVAVKVLNYDSDLFGAYEIDILKTLSHPHIVALQDYDLECYLHHCWYKSALPCSILVLPYCFSNLETVLNKGGRFRPGESFDLILQVFDALRFCHENNVCHRDVKLANLLISQDFRVLLSDFGCSNKTLKSRRRCGTRVYQPPEIYWKYHEYYDGDKVDIWCAGVCFLLLLIGKHPYTSRHADDILYHYIQEQMWNKFFGQIFKTPVSKRVHSMVSSTVCVDPQARVSALHIVNVFKRNYTSEKELKRRLRK
jgi:serine/threonine protein kinase